MNYATPKDKLVIPMISLCLFWERYRRASASIEPIRSSRSTFYKFYFFVPEAGAGWGTGEELDVGPGVGARGVLEAEAGAEVELSPELEEELSPEAEAEAEEGGGAEAVTEGAGLRDRITASNVIWALMPILCKGSKSRSLYGFLSCSPGA